MTRRSISNCIDSINARLGARSIVLIGLMGAGKTTIGRRLARRLKLDFTDADAEIERAAGKTVAEIFEEDGEAFFRSGEERVIARLLQSGPQVLATGGGAWMSEATRKATAEGAISIWLRAGLEVLMERVSRRPGRPLLKAPDPRAVMRALMEERHPLYALADITVESRQAPHQAIVNDAIRALAQWLEQHEEGQ